MSFVDYAKDEIRKYEEGRAKRKSLEDERKTCLERVAEIEAALKDMPVSDMFAPAGLKEAFQKFMLELRKEVLGETKLGR